MKTLISIVPHSLDFSNVHRLFKQLPAGRKVGLEQEAHVVLYDDAEQAIQEFESGDRSILRIVVMGSARPAPKLPKGMFWIQDDIAQLLSLIRVLHPGKLA